MLLWMNGNEHLSNLKNLYTADFETTTDENDCRVWGWGLYNIIKDKFEYGKDLDSFLNRISKLPNKTKIYFHNLKFDGEFIFYGLFNQGFRHTEERTPEVGEFSTLITHMGVFYSISININGKVFEIIDSLKIIPLSVSKISKAFKLKQLKGDIDYLKHRPVGYELDENEIEYIKNDVEIVGKALLFFFNQGLDRMTQASNAFNDFKTIFGKKRFKDIFPVLGDDKEIRLSYKGGFTYVNPKFQGKEIKRGIVFDVNSLYPSVMYNKDLPYGEPIRYKGKYKNTKIYKCFIQVFRCNFELKENHLPTLQIKNNINFNSLEYLTSSNDVDVTLCLTNVDMELFFKHYNVYNIEWLYGWKFKASNIIFKKYIDKWIRVKEESTINGNEGMRTLSKLMLNSLYGKFALNPIVKSKIPVFHDGRVKYVMSEEDSREPVYIPIASFITSYARAITISAAQDHYDRFIYADTDSIHLVGEEIPEDLDIDSVKLGYWDFEGKFLRGRFIRAKSYIEELYITTEEYENLKESKKKKWVYNKEENIYTQIKVTCAGLPHKCHDQITYDNFKSGLVVSGKLQHNRVKGGVILKEIDFTIQV